MDNILQQVSLKEHQTALFALLTEFDRVCRELEIPYVLFGGTMLGAVRHQGFVPWDDDVDVLMMRPDYERFLKAAPAVLDHEKFYLQKEFSEHWPLFFSKLRLNNTACLEKYHPKDLQTHQGVYIDIFPCDNGARTELGRRIQFLASKIVIAKGLYQRGYDTDSRIKKLFMQLCRVLPMKPALRLSQSGSGDSKMVHTFLGGARSYGKNIYPRELFAHRTMASFEGGQFPIPARYDELLRLLYGDYMRLPPEAERVQKKHAILVDLEHSYEIYEHYRDDMEFDVYTRSIR